MQKVLNKNEKVQMEKYRWKSTDGNLENFKPTGKKLAVIAVYKT